MRLDTLSIQNYRSIEKADFVFHPEFNLLIGANGSGKTSLLLALAACLNEGVYRIEDGYPTISLKPEDARFTPVTFGKQIRYERHYPISLLATGTVFNQKARWNTFRQGEGESSESDGDFRRIIRQKLETMDMQEPFPLPLVAFYSAQRVGKGKASSLEAAAAEKVSRRSAYKSWSNALINRDELENWVIGKTLERLQIIADGESNLSPYSTSSDELQLVNRALLECIPLCIGLKYDLRLRSLLVVFQGGEALPFSTLSDGQQTIIALLADIARRICILNPHLGAGALAATPGIVCIDELDIHLHPEWQRNIITALRANFPQIQFFATSHSPQMVGGLQSEEVTILQQGSPSHPHFTLGLKTSDILTEIMETGARDPNIEVQLRSIFNKVDRGDLVAANNDLQTLKLQAPGLPDYNQLEALIRRKQLIGR